MDSLNSCADVILQDLTPGIKLRKNGVMDKEQTQIWSEQL